MAASLQFTKEVWEGYLAYDGFNAAVMKTIAVTKATPGFVELKMTVYQEQTNRSGNLHGGLICSLVDTVGSLALSSMGMWSSGVSTDIHTTFIRSAGVIGDQIRIEGRVLKAGRNLSYTETKIFHPETGETLATGLHTKFTGKGLLHEKNVTFNAEGTEIVQRGVTNL